MIWCNISEPAQYSTNHTIVLLILQVQNNCICVHVTGFVMNDQNAKLLVLPFT